MYDAKNKKLIAEKINQNIIKKQKIYNVNKSIRTLEKIFRKYNINKGLFKDKITMLINHDFSPAEIFTIEYILKQMDVKYQIVPEENHITEKNCIVLWDNYLNFIREKSIINIDNIISIKNSIKDEEYILLGASENYETVKNSLIKELNINILEYENSDTIIFSRLK